MACEEGRCACPMCSGAVSRTGQAAAMLSWALRMAPTHATHPVWRASAVSDMYRRSVPDMPAPEVAALGDWLNEELHGAVSMRSGSAIAHPLFIGVPQGFGETAIPLSEILEGLVAALVRPLLLEGTSCVQLPAAGAINAPLAPGDCVFWLPGFMPVGEKRCCVEEFSYPASLTRYVRRGNRSERRQRGRGVAAVGFTFKATATFVENEECACSCCEFRQSIAITGHAAGQKHNTEMQEDYIVWSDSTGEHRHSFGRRTQADPKTTAADEEDERGVGDYRDRKLPEKRPHGMDGRDNYYKDKAGTQSDQADGCHYKMEDNVTIYVRAGDTFDLTYRYKGEIWDVCFQRLEEGPKFFTVRLHGRSMFGQVVVEYDAHRSGEDGARGEQLAEGKIVSAPWGMMGPGGGPPSESRQGHDWPRE